MNPSLQSNQKHLRFKKITIPIPTCSIRGKSASFKVENEMLLKISTIQFLKILIVSCVYYIDKKCGY